MKKLLISMLLLLGLATNGMAYFVGGTYVGDVDYRVGAANVNSGYDSELTWVNSLVDPDYISFMKYEGTQKWSGWSFVNGSTSIVAVNIVNAPEYYFIKIGTGSLGTNIDHYLFRNDSSNKWAVIDLANSFDTLGHDIALTKFELDENGSIGRFSHEGAFGSNPVPEPGTMVLLGAGMLGLAIFGKRRLNRE